MCMACSDILWLASRSSRRLVKVVGRMEEEIVRVAQVREGMNFPFLFLCISRILCGEDDLGGASHVWRMMLRRRRSLDEESQEPGVSH